MERINKTGKHKVPLDLFYYFQFFMLTVQGLARMGSVFTWVTGGGRGEGTQQLRSSSAPDGHPCAPQPWLSRSLLDPADTLHLEGLGMRAPLPEMLVVPRVVVTLQHILKTSVSRELAANPAVGGKSRTGA